MIPKNCEWVEGWASFQGSNVVPRIDHVEKKYLDVHYGPDPLQVMDIYLPQGEIQKRRVFVLIHGGGFTHCDKRDFHLYPGFFALERGYALVSLNYRLAPKHPFPDGLNDVLSALEWICDHRAEYGFDPQRLFLYGPSAGGNFSALAAMQAKDRLGEKGTVRAAAALCPAVDMLNLRSDWKQIPNKSILTGPLLKLLYRQYFGRRRSDPAVLEAASYMPHLNASCPPMILQMGDKDPVIPLCEVVQMHRRLVEAIGEENAVLDIMHGAAHSGGDENYYLRKNADKVLDFFEKYR